MNHGLDLTKEQEELRGDEYVFGALSPKCLFSVPEDERETYLPIGELQNIGEEKSGCVSRAYINILETKFNYAYTNGIITASNKAWLEANGYVKDGKITFSDAFIEILSGTTKQGNSLKAPVHTIHEYGLVPKQMLPQLDTFTAHYNPLRITHEHKVLGEEFLKRFSINYEQVFTADMTTLLAHDSVAMAVYAWPFPVDGEYPKAPGLPFNHCVMGYALPMTYIFDNYIDSSDGDFIKKLHQDYVLYDYAYRVYISSQNDMSLNDLPDSQKVPLFTWLAKMIAWIFTKQGPMPEVPKEIKPEPIQKPTKKPTVPVKESKLTLWADAIELFESGGDLTAPSYTRRNPGNIREPNGAFKVFATYEAGYSYLCNYLIRAATNEHQAYVQKAAQLKKNSSGLLTIREFIEVYTFGDSAEIQANYSAFIARHCGVPVDTCIKDIL